MATTSAVHHQMETRDFHKNMASFPCMFNMPCYSHPEKTKLKARQDQLIDDINKGIDDKVEERKTKNALTWIFYQLGLYDQAIDMNESVLMESEYKCVVALGNCVFMDWLRTGQVSENYNLLVELSVKPDFKDQVLEAKAEQARCLEQLGYMSFLICAAELYEYILAYREHSRWRYRLGLTYRRLARMNGIEKHTRSKLNKTKCHEKAKECFEKVSRCSDECLVTISRVNIASFYAATTQETIIGVERGERIDPYNSEVCLIGGMALIDIANEYAVRLLERAVEIDPKRSVSHHQLGKAYRCQSEVIRRTNYDKAKEIQKKAEKHFRSAYEFSFKLNLAPLSDLADLHRKMYNFEMATNEASTLLSSRHVAHNLIQVTDCHELLFQLCKSAHHLYLSILTSIALLNSEPTNDNRYAVCSTLFEIDQRSTTASPKMNVKAQGLLRKLKGNRCKMPSIFKSIYRLVPDGRIDEASAVVGEAMDMAGQGHDLEALLFLELTSLRIRMDNSELNCLHLKLLITEAKLCLKDSLSVFCLFFRQSFDLIFSNEEICGDEPELDSDIPIKVDIVVVFNDSIENSSTLCADTAYGLEVALRYIFQLEVAFNPILEASSDGGQGASLVDFVKKHAVAVIVVVFQGDGAETQCLLEKLGPFISERHGADKDQRPLVVMIQCDEQPTLGLPADMKNLPCLSLGQPGDKFPNLFCLKEAQDKANESPDIRGFVQAYFERNDDNVMTLFNHLTRHNDQ